MDSGIEDGSCNQDIGHEDEPEHENQDNHRGHKAEVHEPVRIGIDIDGKEVSDGAHDHHDKDGSWQDKVDFLDADIGQEKVEHEQGQEKGSIDDGRRLVGQVQVYSLKKKKKAL